MLHNPHGIDSMGIISEGDLIDVSRDFLNNRVVRK